MFLLLLLVFVLFLTCRYDTGKTAEQEISEKVPSEKLPEEKDSGHEGAFDAQYSFSALKDLTGEIDDGLLRPTPLRTETFNST